MKKLLAFITASAMIALCAFGLTSCGENYPKATDFQIQWGIKQINSDYIVTPEPGKGYATVKYTNDKYDSIIVYDIYLSATDAFDKEELAKFLVKHDPEKFETEAAALEYVNENDIKLHLKPSGMGTTVKSGRDTYYDVQLKVGSYYDLYEYANTYAAMENFEFESYSIGYIESNTNIVFIDYNAVTGEYSVRD